jgi:cell division protein FtsQ
MTKNTKHIEPESTTLTQRLSSHGFFISIAMLMLLLCAVGVFRLMQPASLPYAKIQIVGELHYVDKNQLNQTVLTHIDGGFFSLNVEQLRYSVALLPWIQDVAVRRVWPDVLQVVVTEQQPVALWNDNALVNRYGDIFSAATDAVQFDHPVRLEGPEGMHRSLLSYYQSVQGQLSEFGLEVQRVSVNDRRAMQVWLANGVQLRLGRVRDELDSSIELTRFLKAYKRLLAPKLDKIDYVDLRYTNGLAVQWKQQEFDSNGRNTVREQNNNSTSVTG